MEQFSLLRIKLESRHGQNDLMNFKLSHSKFALKLCWAATAVPTEQWDKWFNQFALWLQAFAPLRYNEDREKGDSDSHWCQWPETDLFAAMFWWNGGMTLALPTPTCPTSQIQPGPTWGYSPGDGLSPIFSVWLAALDGASWDLPFCCLPFLSKAALSLSNPQPMHVGWSSRFLLPLYPQSSLIIALTFRHYLDGLNALQANCLGA